MSVINTNISALKASYASAAADRMLGTAMERLSSGKRRSRHREPHER